MSAVRFRRVAVIVAVAAAATGITPLAPAGAGNSVSAPFSWEGASWCPNFYGIQSWETCGAPTDSSAGFYPSQVSYSTSSAPISLEIRTRAATESGAFTEMQETWSAPATLLEEINLPCDGSEIENWPAFWLVTTGSWPKGGEIDVMEGLNGQAEWHYHYLSAQGVDSQVGGSLGSGCGTHYYGVKWTSWRSRSTTTARPSVPLRPRRSEIRFRQVRCSSSTTTRPHPTMAVRRSQV